MKAQETLWWLAQSQSHMEGVQLLGEGSVGKERSVYALYPSLCEKSVLRFCGTIERASPISYVAKRQVALPNSSFFKMVRKNCDNNSTFE